LPVVVAVEVVAVSLEKDRVTPTSSLIAVRLEGMVPIEDLVMVLAVEVVVEVT
jgi:hypothetical protein